MAGSQVVEENQRSTKYQKLIELGERNGRLTYDDVNRVINDESMSVEDIDDIFVVLNDLEIPVVDDGQEDGGQPSRVKVHTPDPEENDDEDEAEGNPLQEIRTRADDPVRIFA